MHTLTHEAVAGNGANVVQFPNNDTIEVVTGLLLVDADPKVIARALRPKKWKARARFFNNAIGMSLDAVIEMARAYGRSLDKNGEFLEWGCVEMMRRVGETLDLWGDAEPANVDAVALFLVSLNPKHQRAARHWLKAQKEQPAPSQFIDAAIDKHWPTLAMFFRMVTIGMLPCVAAWRAEPQECPDDWYDPAKLPDDADTGGGAA